MLPCLGNNGNPKCRTSLGDKAGEGLIFNSQLPKHTFQFNINNNYNYHPTNLLHDLRNYHPNQYPIQIIK
jgi:hypothetical protein